MRAASHALTWAIERADEPIAKAIDGTYRSVIDWLERQVDSR